MGSIYTVSFWKDAGERAVATGLQVLAGLITVDSILNLGSLDYKAIGAAMLSAALFSIVKSLIAAATGVKGSASITSAVEPVRSAVERVRELAPEIESMVHEQVVSVQERLIRDTATAVAQVQDQVQSIDDVVREQLARLGR